MNTIYGTRGHLVVGLYAGVAVRDTGSQFLGRGVHENVDRIATRRVPALGDRGNPVIFERDRIGVAAHHEIVTNDDRMLAFLGRPSSSPAADR